MFSIQYALAFWMIDLILFRILNFEPQKEVKRLSLTLFIMLGVFDLVRHIHYGYQPVSGYATLIGFGALFVTGVYAIGTFQSWRAWLSVGLVILIAMFISLVADGFIFTLLRIDTTLSAKMRSIYDVIGISAGALLLFVFYQVVKKFNWNVRVNADALTKMEVVLIIFFLFVFGYFVTAIYALGRGHEHQGLGALISFLALLSGIVALYLMMHLAKQKSVIKEVESREKQQALVIKQQMKHDELMSARNEEIKVFRHNIHDELTYLHGLLLNSECEKSILYVRKMRGVLTDIDQKTKVVDTGSKAVNASWNVLINDEQYQEITATWTGKLPVDLLIDDRDLLLLFSNVLSNAFEAAQKASDKYVKVKIDRKDNGLFINVSNSYSDAVQKTAAHDFVTSKADQGNHGIGTRIIKNVIDKYKKYHGQVQFSYSDGNFWIAIFFNGDIYGEEKREE